MNPVGGRVAHWKNNNKILTLPNKLPLMDMDNVPEEFMTFGVGDLWKRGVILRMTLNASGCSPGFSLIILTESGAVSTD